MNCPRCGGADGAHYAFCFFEHMWDQLMGPTHPWRPPATRSVQEEVKDEIDNLSDEAISQIGEQYAAGRDERPVLPAFTLPEPKRDDDYSPEAVARTEDLDDEEAAEQKTRAQAASTGPTERQREAARNAAAARLTRDTQRLEEAVVQFLYDETENAPDAGMELRTSLHAAFLGWLQIHRERHVPIFGLGPFRKVIEELGYRVEKGRLPGGRTGGKAPLLVYGLRFKTRFAAGPEPEIKLEVKSQPEPSLEEQMALRRAAEAAFREAEPEAAPAKERYRYTGQRPGQEIPTEYRELLEPLWSIPGWSYQKNNPNGRGKPRVIAPDGRYRTIPNTPSDYRGVKNARTDLRNNLNAPL